MTSLAAVKQEPDDSASAAKNKELLHYYPFGKKKIYKLCGKCDFKTTTNFALNRHLKMAHPFSTTAKVQPPAATLNEEKEQFRCTHCPFKNRSKVALKRHVMCHENKSGQHQCHLCGFSVNNRGNLTLHMKLHSRESGENTDNSINKVNPLMKREKADGSSLTGRRNLLSCRHCYSFKTTSVFVLKRHVKRVHPFSLPALSPSIIKQKNIHQLEGTGQQIEIANREEWYVPPSGVRKRYIYCGDCDYRSVARSSINKHAEMMHPSSTTAIPTIKREPDDASKLRFQCSMCSYRNAKAKKIQNHEALHRIKSEFQCHLCSYSVSNNGVLTYHLKWQHNQREPKRKESVSYLNSRKHHKESTITHSMDGVRRKSIVTHLKSSQVEVVDCAAKMLHHSDLKPATIKKMRYECSMCSFQARKSKMIQNHEALHRIKSKFQCPYCSYSVKLNGNLVRHLNRQHPQWKPNSNVENAESSAKKASVENQKKKKKRLRKCLECDYSTCEKGKLIIHIMNHRRNGRFKCQYCTYSSDFKTSIPLHLKYGHRRHLKTKAAPARIQGMELEVKLKKQFGIKECRVVLQDIRSSLTKLINTENAEVLPISEEAIQIAVNVQPEDERIQLLRSRLEAMEERARITEEEVKEITLKKVDLQKRIKETAGRRVVIEYDLRSEQCNLIEMNLSALETDDEDFSGIMKPVEEKIKSLEKKMNVIESELMALKGEEKSLVQDLEDAQGSHVGIVQVLKALQSELNGLLL